MNISTSTGLAAPGKDRQTLDEWQYLRTFQYLCTDFPSGQIQKHERPDFLVTTDSGLKIGIEITRVYKARGKNTEQSVEATKEAIKIAALSYAECHLRSPPASVALFYSLSRALKFKEQQRIARLVAQVVHDNMPPEGQSVALEYRRGGVQPIEVDLMQINRVHHVAAHH